MPRAVPGLIALALAGCTGDPATVTFRIVDLDGALVGGSTVGCHTGVYYDDDRRGGEIEDLGDGTYVCHPAEDRSVTLTSRYLGRASAELSGVAPGQPGIVDVPLWAPDLDATEVSGEWTLSWDPAPRLPAGWSAEPLRVWLSGPDLAFDAQPDAIGLIVPLDLLEDHDVQVIIEAEDTGVAGSLYRDVSPDGVFDHTSSTPMSRGLGCHVRRNDGSELDHEAGACPVTNGVVREPQCIAPCITLVQLDLGADVSVGRIHVTAPGSPRIQISSDGAAFTEVPDGATLFDTTARYVLVDRVNDPIHEVSVYAP